MKISANDLAAAYVEWVKSEIKEGPKQGYDLGKFFFTVSIGTIGALATIEKLNGEMAMLDKTLLTALSILFVSILLALDLARPRTYRLGRDTDLQEQYVKQIKAINRRVGLWLVLWLAGTFFGAYAVYQ